MAYSQIDKCWTYLDGKWQISDPTFNVSAGCSNGARNLSVPEAIACLRGGHEIVWGV